MVVARASGMDLASSLKRNTFLTLGVRPVGGPGSARDGGTEGAPGRGDTGGPGTGGHGGGPRLFLQPTPHPPKRAYAKKRGCINLGVGGGWVRLKSPAPPPTQKKGG